MNKHILTKKVIPITLCVVAILVALIFPQWRRTYNTTPLVDPEIAAEAMLSVLDSGPWTKVSGEDMLFTLSGLYIVPEDSYLSAAVYRGPDLSGEEVAVIRLSSPDKQDDVVEALSNYQLNRYGDFYGYLPEQAAMIENGKVIAGEQYVALLLCREPEKAEQTLRTYVQDISRSATMTVADTDGYIPFDPPNHFDMTVYDTSVIHKAAQTGQAGSLSEKDAAILARCRDILDCCITDGMSDFEKELAVHDWMVENCVVDQSAYIDHVGKPDNTNPYGLLVNGYGICLGYATSFQLLMELAGVECQTVVGADAYSTNDHAWNMVKLDGEWYCVDTIWDQSSKDVGKSSHAYFNITSEQMRETNHQWDYQNTVEATGTKYAWYGYGHLAEIIRGFFL